MKSATRNWRQSLISAFIHFFLQHTYNDYLLLPDAVGSTVVDKTCMVPPLIELIGSWWSHIIGHR